MKLFTEKKETKKEWALKSAQLGDDVVLVAIDAQTGGEINTIGYFSDTGFVSCCAAKDLLEKHGYDISCTQWTDRGEIKCS